jgi:hypothetical protein
VEDLSEPGVLMRLQFVILHHTGIDQPHFDVMVETSPASKLTTWRSPCWPIDRPTVLTQLGEHRRDYLDYEGPISNDRGQVKRVARGQCNVIRADDNSIWTIQFADPTMPPINIRHVERDRWLAVPSCGGE